MSKTIKLIVTPSTSDLHQLDVNVPGTYLFDVSDEVDENYVANMVLDTFHDEIPIKTLEDFAFEVKDSEDNLYTGDACIEPYMYSDCGEIEYLGMEELILDNMSF